MKGLINNIGAVTLTTALIASGAVLAVLGTAGGIVGYNAYQEKKYEEEVAAFELQIEEARNSTINDYNGAVELVMSCLTFTNEDGEAVTLDTNRDLDAMSNAVGGINSIIENVNSNEWLTQEQKDVLVMSCNDKIGAINARIETVNEENRIAEELRAAEEAAARERAAKASSQSTTTKKFGQSSGSNSSSNSSASESSSDDEPTWIDLGDGYGKWSNEGGAWVEAHPEYGINKRFYDRTGIFAAGIAFKDEHPDAVVHFSGMGIDMTL